MPDTRIHAPHPFAAAAAVGCGVLLAVQARVNGTLSAHGHPALTAALWSFFSGMAVLTLALAFPSARRGVRRIRTGMRGGRLRWWQCLGGVGGALLIAVQAYAVPIIGVAIFSVAVIGGQTLCALGVDRLGLSPSGRHPVTVRRLLAAGLAIAGVAMASAGSGSHLAIVPVVLSVLVGAGTSIQQAFNAHVTRVGEDLVATTWQNFGVGCVVLVLVALGEIVVSRTTWQFPSTAPWWAWVGGLLGIAFIAAAAWAVLRVGVLIFGLLAVAGQLTSALALDLLDPATRPSVGAALVAGVAVTLAAAAISLLRPRR